MTLNIFATNSHCKKKNTTLARVYACFLWSYSTVAVWPITLPLPVSWQLFDSKDPGGTIPGDGGGISSLFGVPRGHTLKTSHRPNKHWSKLSLQVLVCSFTQRLVNLMSKHSSDLPSFRGSPFRQGLIEATIWYIFPPYSIPAFWRFLSLLHLNSSIDFY